VMIMQRLHELDPTGFLLELSGPMFASRLRRRRSGRHAE
jgi:hypothetical protein